MLKWAGHILWIMVACACGSLPAFVSAAEESANKNSTKNKRLEDSPEVAEKLKAAIEKIGKNKTGTLKINTAEIEAAQAAKAAKAAQSTQTAKTATKSAASSDQGGVRATDAASAKKSTAKKSTGTTTAASQTPESPAHALTHTDAHWAYEGQNGPESWATLAPENKTCATGKRQSPIPIQDGDTFALAGMENIGFEYRPSPASIIHNGHTLQVDMQGDNRLRVRGSEYRLVQFHFHHPAEERINNRSFDLVAHLVHRGADGQLAVVAILFEIGAPNGLLDTVWGNLPLETGDRVRWSGPAIDLAKLLPTDRRYYQFIGSLTTPPCSEGVLWIILKQPVTLSAQQLAVFARLFPNNARPLQPVNGRIIKSAQ